MNFQTMHVVECLVYHSLFMVHKVQRNAKIQTGLGWQHLVIGITQFGITSVEQQLLVTIMF